MTSIQRSLRTSLALGVGAALILGAVAAVLPGMAQAATLTSLSATWATSKPATATNMRFQFTTVGQLNGDTTAADDDATIFVRLPTAGTDPFAISGGLVAGDVLLTGFPANVTVNSVVASNRGGSAANDTIAIGLNMTNAGAGVNINASSALTVDIVNNRITTPSKVAAAGTADIFELSFATRDNGAGTDLDTGGTQTSFVDVTSASATVNTTLTFTVAAIANATSVFGVTTDAASTVTTVPFGTLAPNAPKEVGQRLTITTNAPNGYSVYVVQSANLTAGGNDIDQFKDGTRVDDGANAAWSSPAVVASAEATYGHLGYGTTDTSVFTNNQWAGVPTIGAAGAAPITTGLACNNAGQTSGDTCDVVYKVETSALQEAGSYTNEIIYVVAPLY